uniref:hypothetical protein n=1 Tax=Pseudomonas fluorescens TaxID=294 RepID=UPI002B1E30E6
ELYEFHECSYKLAKNIEGLVIEKFKGDAAIAKLKKSSSNHQESEWFFAPPSTINYYVKHLLEEPVRDEIMPAKQEVKGNCSRPPFFF